MKEKLEEIKKELPEKLKDIVNPTELSNLKAEYFGKNGKVKELSLALKELTNDEKKEFGKNLNEIKTYVENLIKEKSDALEESKLKEKLKAETIDVTLPGVSAQIGAPNLLEAMTEDLEELFLNMGYDVVEGPEIELDEYNFELLNLPKGNPVRDAQDTFYTKGDTLLLRSQTSPVQVREMLANEEKSPIRIVCPGKTYRRDYDDATHSHQFTQMEGLLIDKDISLADLKGTFDVVASHLFGDVETRFRSSFYPFTEPSVELDVSCFNCHKKGCSICKNTGWITVGGAGIVHPKVLTNCGYDKEKYTGFAFGFGLERLAMLKYDIKDIRTFYTNDLRSSIDRRDV